MVSGLAVAIVRTEPTDLHATRPGPEHGVRVGKERGVTALLQGRTPEDLLCPALGPGPVVAIEPRDPVQQFWWSWIISILVEV